MTTPIRIGIVTVSDRASQGVYEDLGGPAIRDCLTEILSCPWEAGAAAHPRRAAAHRGDAQGVVRPREAAAWS